MNESGFTLIEIIVAVTITGLVLGSVFAILNQSFSLWERVSISNSWEQNFRILVSQLESDLTSVFISPLSTNNLFEGSNNKIEFLIYNKDRQLEKITYSYDSYEQSLKKVVTYPKQDKTKETIDFFSDLELTDVEFEFYDPSLEYYKSSWSFNSKLEKYNKESLEDQLNKILPSVIRIRVKLKNRTLPPIVIENFIGRKYGG